MMEYTRLGTGLKVSRLCLGTMNFGPQTSEEDSHAIMDKALELGINFFDTANVYGWKVGEGVTEQIIGRWLAQGGGRREKIVLATKVYGAMGDWPNDRGLSAFTSARPARRACAGCRPTTSTSTRCTTSTEHALGGDLAGDGAAGAQGKVIYVGSSNFAAGTSRRPTSRRQPQLHGPGLRAEPLQPDARTIELEVCPPAADYGLGVIPWSPLAGGLLGGALQKKQRRPPRGRSAAKTHRGSSASSSRPTKGSVKNSAKSPPTWRSPGC
jgi:NDP-hexose C3-ketoreductase / dTDP-4-oxo-2-deoxy-alpha-D-pentos-2-ene 2,3-reductase